VNLTPAQYDTALHGGLEFQQSLPVNASIQRVRVIVVDKDSGSTGSLTMPMGQ
jgi:hypothetical protein